MDDLPTIWESWSPEVRAEVLQVRDSEIAQLLEQRMRLLWAGELQARQFGMQDPESAFDQTQLPLVAAMQFHTFLSPNSGSMVCQSVSWPQDFHRDATIVPAALRLKKEANGSPKRPLSRVPKVERLGHLLQPAATNWTEFERQITQLVEQLVLKAFSEDCIKSKESAKNSIAGFSCSGPSNGQNRTANKLPQTEEVAEGLEDDEELAGDAEKGEVVATGRAAKRARQRERRRMFKAAAREGAAGEFTASRGSFSEACDATGIVGSAVSPMLQPQPSLQAVPPGTWSALPGRGMPMQPSLSGGSSRRLDAGMELVQGMCAAPTSGTGMAAGERSVVRGAGGGRPPDLSLSSRRDPRDVPFVWQPPGIWEPARIVMKDDSPAGLGSRGLSSDTLADADAELDDAVEETSIVSKEDGPATAKGLQQPRTLSAEDQQPRKVSADEVAIGADMMNTLRSRVDLYAQALDQPRSIAGNAGATAPDHELDIATATSVEAGAPALAGVGEALLEASGKRKESTEELTSLVEKLLVKEEDSQQNTNMNPWTGRPVGYPDAPVMGLGRGKPMGGDEPQARYSDDFAGMGMGRGRRLAPPPGIGSAQRGMKAPGGLSKEWRPEPPIPEEELDPEHQDMAAWSSNMELPSRLLLAASAAAASFRDDESAWSKASYCGTPSMAWSKTPSPPGTPCLLGRNLPEWQSAMGLGNFSEYSLPPGAIAHPGSVAHMLQNPHMVTPIPMYVTVPVAMTHNCPHCGRGFALPDASSAGQAVGRQPSAAAPTSPQAAMRASQPGSGSGFAKESPE